MFITVEYIDLYSGKKTLRRININHVVEYAPYKHVPATEFFGVDDRASKEREAKIMGEANTALILSNPEAPIYYLTDTPERVDQLVRKQIILASTPQS